MSDHEGVTARYGVAAVLCRCAIISLAGGTLVACNVIKPDLLDDASPMAARPPADAFVLPPVDASSAPDAPPDAYVPEIGNLVVNAGFEQQGTTGWTTSGHGTIGLATTAAHTGTRSLLTTDRTAVWNGPATAITNKVRAGRSYTMSAFTRLMDAGTESFYLSMRHTCAEDGQHFNEQTTRTMATAPDELTWAQPITTFTIAAAADCTLTEVLVYVETITDLSPATSYPAFYLDDIVVTEDTP
jgi:endo-1,4-beta-xylanase